MNDDSWDAVLDRVRRGRTTVEDAAFLEGLKLPTREAGQDPGVDGAMSEHTLNLYARDQEIYDVAFYPDGKPNGELDSVHFFTYGCIVTVNWRKDGLEVDILG